MPTKSCNSIDDGSDDSHFFEKNKTNIFFIFSNKKFKIV